MTTETRTIHTKPFASRWQRFQWWSAAVAEAIDYDPQVQVETNMKHLRSEVDRLNTRVIELEEQHRNESVSANSDSVQRG